MDFLHFALLCAVIKWFLKPLYICTWWEFNFVMFPPFIMMGVWLVGICWVTIIIIWADWQTGGVSIDSGVEEGKRSPRKQEGGGGWVGGWADQKDLASFRPPLHHILQFSQIHFADILQAGYIIWTKTGDRVEKVGGKETKKVWLGPALLRPPLHLRTFHFCHLIDIKSHHLGQILSFIAKGFSSFEPKPSPIIPPSVHQKWKQMLFRILREGVSIKKSTTKVLIRAKCENSNSDLTIVNIFALSNPALAYFPIPALNVLAHSLTFLFKGFKCFRSLLSFSIIFLNFVSSLLNFFIQRF